MSTTLQHLHQISQKLNEWIANDPTNTPRHIVQLAAELIPNSIASIFLWDEDNPQTDFITATPAATSHPQKMPPRAAGIQHATAFLLQLPPQTLATLHIIPNPARPLTPTEHHLLSTYTTQAALALAHSQQHTTHTGEELRRLRQTGMLISARTSLQATFDTILQYALEVMHAEYGILRLVDETGKHLVSRATAGVTPTSVHAEKLPINRNSVMGTVALDRRPLVIAELRQKPWCDIYYPLDHEMEMRSEIAVPLIGASNRLEGVLNLESPHPNAFRKQDRYILQIFATQAVSTIQEARLIDALQQISTRFLAEPQQTVLEHLAAQACDLLNAQVGLVWLLDGNQLVVQAATDSALCGRRVPLAGGLTGQAITSGAAVVSSNVCEDARFLQPEQARARSWGSALCVPITVNGDATPRGVFSIYTTANDLRDFDPAGWDTKVVTILAHYAAIAMQSVPRPNGATASLHALTPRERDVLELLVNGMTNKEIAAALFVTHNTVKRHLKSIFVKLRVSTRAAAVAKAMGA